MARNSSVIPSPSIVPSATYIPWRDRPHLQLKVASEIAGVSPASLYRFSDEGRLKLRELGGRTLVDTKSLIALIETAKDWTPKKRGEESRYRSYGKLPDKRSPGRRGGRGLPNEKTSYLRLDLL